MKLLIRLLLFVCVGFSASGQSSKDLEIHHLTGDFYIYVTYHHYQGERISANGMYMVTNQGVVLIDSPWDTTQFQPLLNAIKTKHQKEVVMCIATHFHEDRTAGLEYYRNKGIKTYTTRLTDQLSASRGMKRAEFLITKDTTFNIGGHGFSTYYPGHGHAPDNIVLWFEAAQILYGGCLIKSVDDKTLGNLADADVKAYPKTIVNALQQFKDPKFVITGHGDYSDVRARYHTLQLARQLNAVPLEIRPMVGLNEFALGAGKNQFETSALRWVGSDTTKGVIGHHYQYMPAVSAPLRIDSVDFINLLIVFNQEDIVSEVSLLRVYTPRLDGDFERKAKREFEVVVKRLTQLVGRSGTKKTFQQYRPHIEEAGFEWNEGNKSMVISLYSDDSKEHPQYSINLHLSSK